MKLLIKKFLEYFGVSPNWTKWYFFNNHEVDESDIIAEFFKKTKNRTMLDVGFAWGQASIPFLFRGWHVYGFEPDNSVTKTAAINHALGKFPNLSIEKKAVSNSSGDVLTFYTSNESEGISSLHSFKSHSPSHSVTTITLDDFIADKKINEIDFLKIDTEGHDIFVIKGLSFRKTAPKVILAEFDDYKTIPLGYTYRDLGNLLLEEAYDVWLFEWYPIEKYGVKHKFRHFSKFPALLKNEKAWGNFIAIHPSIAQNFETFLLTSRYKIFHTSQ